MSPEDKHHLAAQKAERNRKKGSKHSETEQDTASHPQWSQEELLDEETLLFSRKKHLHKKKGLLEMDTVVAEMKASSTTEAEQ